MHPDISVVVPMKNEAPNVDELYRELTSALEACGRPYEIVAVDDGSTDETFARLARLQASDYRLRVIQLRRNFGQTAAFAAGFAHARGRYIVTMDGDLQNDPRDIGAMVDLLEQTPADIVAGWRKDRKDAFINRRLPSTIANWLISRATGVKLHDYGCSLKVFRAEVVKSMKLYGEMHRFLPAIASEFGVTIGEKVVNHRKRTHGKSNYGISRTLRVVLDLITVKYMIQYLTSPMKLFGGIGLLSGFVGFLSLAATIFMKLAHSVDMTGNPLLLLTVFASFVSLQFFVLGMLGELCVRTYYESQGRQPYAFRELLNFSDDVVQGGDKLAA